MSEEDFDKDEAVAVRNLKFARHANRGQIASMITDNPYWTDEQVAEAFRLAWEDYCPLIDGEVPPPPAGRHLLEIVAEIRLDIATHSEPWFLRWSYPS